MIRRLAAIVLALHGAIHLIGFVAPWRIATLEGFAYRTTVFNGALDVRDAGARVVVERDRAVADYAKTYLAVTLSYPQLR